MKAVVVAHPDDEALWLSSCVASAERIVFGFGAVFGKPRRSRARQQAVAALPLTGIVSLQIRESGVEWKSYQASPQLAPTGVEIEEPSVRKRYEENFGRLLQGLRVSLAGCSDVYTHNPWGEYGHPEHIQIYRAVSALQEELRFTVWYTNYISARNWAFGQGLTDRLSWTERVVAAPDLITAHALRKVYRHHGAWTWPIAHRWPTQEVMYAQRPTGSSDGRHSFAGEWLIDVTRLRWGQSLWRSPRRFIRQLQESLEHASS